MATTRVRRVTRIASTRAVDISRCTHDIHTSLCVCSNYGASRVRRRACSDQSRALRDARTANSQMESAYQERINQLQTQIEALVQGQAMIGQRFAELISKIVPNVPSTKDN